MSERSIEFQEILEDTSLPKIVRKSFRVPVEDKENVWVLIRKTRYPVLDICLDGIGIALEKELNFAIEEALLDCELTIYDLSVKNLNGQIVHLTAARGEKWRCGIRWINMEKQSKDKMFQIVSKMKEQLLSNDGSSPDSE